MTSLPSPTSIAPLLLEDIAHVEVPGISVTKNVQNDCIGATAEPEVSEQLHEPYGNTGTEDEQKEMVQQSEKYEYLDIRSNSLEENDQCLKSRGSEASLVEATQIEGAHQSLQTYVGIIAHSRPDVLTAGEETVEEYEEMAKIASGPDGWELPEYQNLPENDTAVSEELGGTRCAGIGGYIKVCAGMGDPGSNASFDNPDYWHSRLFLKPDALRT